eukprot:jgi/Botrbrau1/15555/Bobra.0273s0007.1
METLDTSLLVSGSTMVPCGPLPYGCVLYSMEKQIEPIWLEMHERGRQRCREISDGIGESGFRCRLSWTG